MNIIIKEVVSKKDLKDFINSQWIFYKNDKNFVPPLKQERMELLDNNKNPFFEHSEIKSFIAYNNNQIVGRISAIINHNHNKTHNDKIGFFGFFECIDNQNVANTLFESAENWLKNKGINCVRGPMNPSINDEFSFLLEGFDSPPVVLMSYNPEYYLKLTENAGYKKVKDLYAYHLSYKDYLTQKLIKAQEIIRKRYNIKVRHFNFKNKMQFNKDIESLKQIYNEAWEENWGHVKLTDNEFNHLVKSLKQIADEKLVLIAECNGELAGAVLAVPDVNQVLINNKKGSLLGAIWYLLTGKNKINRMRIIILGVLPKFRRTGLDAVLYYDLAERAKKRGIKEAEASWILEDNEMMNKGLNQTLNGKLYKKYRVYEKEI